VLRHPTLLGDVPVVSGHIEAPVGLRLLDTALRLARLSSLQECRMAESHGAGGGRSGHSPNEIASVNLARAAVLVQHLMILIGAVVVVDVGLFRPW
jgi:hypothetical protein